MQIYSTGQDLDIRRQTERHEGSQEQEQEQLPGRVRSSII